PQGYGRKKGRPREQPFHCQAAARLREAMTCYYQVLPHAHEPVTDLSHLAGPSAEAKIQFMHAGDRGDRQ
ncbi:MAG TPA: hypothetical protein VL976_06535, partial [Xanthobacteraceae bacterium]|nr:hypothetical protein [Xanthobacteraceae bacterium]